VTRYAVTGASGWLGRAALELLTARGAEVVGFASRARTVDGHELRPLADLPGVPHDVLLHYGYATRDRAQEMSVIDYVTANVTVTEIVLEALRRQRPRAMFYSSSGAAAQAGTLAENPYAVLKRHDELIFRSAVRDIGGRCAVARVFNVGGPWMSKAFALASLIEQVIAGGPVVVQAPHPVRRSYVDVEDLAALAVALAEGGPAEVMFDTAGHEVVELGDLAARVTRVMGHADMPVDRSWDPAAPADDYVGDGELMHALAAEHGVALRGLDEQIARTADWLGSRAAVR
jgi:UDP-glucuronate decarboxylase